MLVYRNKLFLLKDRYDIVKKVLVIYCFYFKKIDLRKYCLYLCICLGF